jgi:hypothetical protein
LHKASLAIESACHKQSPAPNRHHCGTVWTWVWLSARDPTTNDVITILQVIDIEVLPVSGAQSGNSEAAKSAGMSMRENVPKEQYGTKVCVNGIP